MAVPLVMLVIVCEASLLGCMNPTHTHMHPRDAARTLLSAVRQNLRQVKGVIKLKSTH